MSQTALEQEGETRSRFVVGIDLGTTNSAMAFVDTEHQRPAVQTFGVPQLVAAGQIEAREALPSFHYHAAAGEFAAGALRLPWQTSDPDYAVRFWDLTNRQDWLACESVQRGVSSPHSRAGPLAPNESAVYDWLGMVVRCYRGLAPCAGAGQARDGGCGPGGDAGARREGSGDVEHD